MSAFLLVMLFPVLLSAQIPTTPVPDEGMDIFLLLFGSAFVCALLGAAVVGAFLATLAVLVFFLLAAFGNVSTSLAIGLYKRSVSAGCKSFFLLFFGPACAVFGAGGMLFLNVLVPLPLTKITILLIGFFGGLDGGLLLGRLVFAVGKELVGLLAKRLNLA